MYNYLFHVHTWRCGHASDEQDEAYIRKAVAMGAKYIIFTDHAPFPGNPFTNRMPYEQLDSYLASLKYLKEKYRHKITVKTGLEIEYLPSFRDYYEELRANKEIDMLMLGQHHYEESRGQYFFHDSEMAYFGLGNATLKGMNTGLFDVVAHPDRIFKAHTHWCEAFDRISELMITIAMNRNIYLEKNTRSMCRLQSKEYRPEFWKLVPADAKIIYGCDAHSTAELRMGEEIRCLN